MRTSESFKVGDWLVEPKLDRISSGCKRRNVRPKVMDLLVYLADRPGEVVSSDELLEKLWPDRVVTEGSVYRCIGELREVLEQGKVTPIYIETIPKKGYRLRSRVIRAAEDNDVANTPSPRVSILIVLVALLAAAVSATLIWDRVQDEPLANDPARPSIAILALRPIDFEEGNDYFSEGLSEDLITRLARIPELRVISRSSSFSFMQTDASIPEIAGKLGVEFIIDGSVRLNDNRVRITAQLIDAEQDSVLWSDSYDRKIDDVFYVQAEVSSAIVAALKTELGLHISMPTQAVAQTSPEARDAYLRGRHLIVQRSTVAIEDAAREFRTAIALDPEYAPAHAELAVATLLLTRRMYGGPANQRRFESQSPSPPARCSWTRTCPRRT